ncbi:RRM domain-containing protein [Aphelenchoides fujianensis]|nr:RRM domain-containing protein [Aphelenchoides fujianensis]
MSEVEVEATKNDENEGKPEEFCRIKLANLPTAAKTAQLKKLLNSNLKEVGWKKLTVPPNTGIAYFSVGTAEEAEKASALLNGHTYKNHKIVAFTVADKAEVRPKRQDEPKQLKNVIEITTPLAHLTYDEQIDVKFKDSTQIAEKLIKQMAHARVPNARYIKAKKLLKPIIRCDKTSKYRNKIECTIGLDEAGDPCVGFVSGRMAERKFVIVPVDRSTILTDKMQAIVCRFTDVVKESGLAPFEEFTREGFWKKLVVRDFAASSMLIVTVHPLADEQQMAEVKRKVVETFGSGGQSPDLRVDSIYWQILENASDPCVYEHVDGAEHIHENLLGVRFRVSAQSFFQTNSRGAALLYTVIGDLMGLPKAVESAQSADGKPKEADGKPKEAEADERMDVETSDGPKAGEEKPVALLDICCGAGTIGQCLLERLRKNPATRRQYAVIGVELVKQAVEDARLNAKENGFTKENCRYIEGPAEVVFRNLNDYVQYDLKMRDPELIGVLDPPRNGVSDKVIISCRRLESMKRIIYVSCDPSAAIKNLVDLCRATSNKYEGEPFRLATIQPVDIFPYTTHIEWVVELRRD